MGKSSNGAIGNCPIAHVWLQFPAWSLQALDRPPRQKIHKSSGSNTGTSWYIQKGIGPQELPRIYHTYPYIIVTRWFAFDLSWHRSIVTAHVISSTIQLHDPAGSNCLRVNLFQRDEAGLLCIEFAPEPDSEKDVAVGSVGHAEEFFSDMESRVTSTRNHHCFNGKTAH